VVVTESSEKGAEAREPSGVERLLQLDDPLAPRLDDRGHGPPIWFERNGWRILAPPSSRQDEAGAAVASFSIADDRRAALRYDATSGSALAPFNIGAAYDGYVSERWIETTPNRRLSKRQLNAFYRVKPLIPRKAQLYARRLLIRWQGLPRFPAWPLDLSVARLVRFYAFCTMLAQRRTEASFRWFWPGTFRSAVVLTHDVESQEGLRLAVALADVEEELGFRSSFNLGAWYQVDPGLVRELTSRGFEIGVHGLRHDRSLFASRKSFEEQQERLGKLIARFEARGFRSPATHRVVRWLGELPVDYDCSVPHSDPFEPQPGGCCSLWPFFIGRVVELPYTLPQDHSLFTLLGHRTPQLWIEQAHRIEAEYGLIQCVTHPDPGYLGDPRNRTSYTEFLRAISDRPRVWKALPREVASWWRERDARVGEPMSGTVRIGDNPDDVALDPPAELEGSA
jgi:peptidoglycan/xylan/chitin deacetylase (PgdA/CDA1 family)